MQDVITYSVDRIEGEMAVLVNEEGYSHPVSLTTLPAETKCGDMLQYIQGEYRLAPQATEERRAYDLSLQEKLRRRSK